MRPSLTVISVVFIALTEAQAVLKRETGDLQKKVVCYYTNWSVYRPGTAKFNPQNINPYLCTHLIYAFGGLDRENGLRPYDKYQDIEQGGYAKFTGLKTYNKALKTMLAIGGWNEGSARFSPLVADEERRREFVRNVVKFLRQNHFDGLDLDWEYPAFRDGGKSKDRDNYAQLVQELREEFDKESSKTGRSRLLLTMAVPAGLEYIDKGYDIPKLNRYLDFMNILSYDYHSAYEPSVNHHSPLYSLEEDNEYNFDAQLTIDGTVKHFLLKGADPEKLVLGIPTYGRSYTLFNPDSPELGSPSDGPGEQGDATREKGYLAYYEICDNVKEGWTVVQPKEAAMGPYAYKENQWVGYDDEAIVRKKSQYVNEKNLGGIMFWSIDNDDFRGKCGSRPYPLIEAAKEALLGKSDPGNKISGGSWVRGGKTGSGSGGSSRAKVTSTPAPPPLSLTTPDPPTTPDPGSDFVCKDEGFFPHPRDCKKYFWCLDSGPSNLGIVAHQFTCPSGLFFNKAADSCDFSRNVICKKSNSKTTTTSGTTTTSAPPSSTTSGYSYSTALKNFKSGGGGRVTLPPRTTSYRSTTSRGTTTTEAPLEEEEQYEGQAEDPQTIKQLIHLIKKLGGVAELEKQLEGSSGGVDSTTPAISKSLYQRVLSSGSPRYQTIQRNGPSGPQNEGLPRESGSSHRQRDKPQYVTIRRERPSSTTEAQEEEYSEDDEAAEGKPDGQRKSGGVERTEPKDRPKYQPVERFRGKHRGENRVEEGAPPAAERGVTTPKYTSIFRSRSPTSESSATTSKYVILQRQRPPKPAGEDVGTTENELTDEDETTVEHSGGDTTTARPSRVKVSETSTSQVPTSTSVITEIVEGATRRQRVPLSKLKLFLMKGGINSLETPVDVEATKTSAVTTTTTERPLVHGFNRRRPEVVVTSATQRIAPAFLSGRRSRFRSTTTTSTESSAEETASTVKGRFAPSRGRHRSTTLQDDTPRNSTTEYPGYISANRFRSRFINRRSTTEKPTEFTEEEDELFVKGNSREATVIRKPVYRGRFPSRRRTTSTSVETSEIPSSTTEISSEVSLASPTEDHSSEIAITQSSVLNITTQPDVVNVTDYSPSESTSSLSRDQIVTTLPLSLPLVITTIATKPPLEKQTTQNTRNESEDNVARLHRGRNFVSRNNNTLLPDDIVRTKSSEPNGRQKIILRRKKPTNPTTTYRSVDIVSESVSMQEGVKNKMKIVVRRRKPELKSRANVVSEEDIKIRKIENRQRGRIRFVDIMKKELSSSEDNSVVETKQSHSIPKSTITSPTISPRNKQRRLSIRRNKLPQNTEIQEKTNQSSKEDLPGNYGEKSRGNNGEFNRNKARKVILKRKTLKDLAVDESGTPELEKEGWEEGAVRKRKNSGPSEDLESHSSEDFVQQSQSSAEQQEVQTRTRRPFRRTSSRTTTTSTTEEPVTTGRARTTVQSLKQRLNRFKSERGQGRSWGNQTQTAGGRNPDQGDAEVGSTQRPRRVEFRRLIRPVADDSQLDASDVTKSSRPRNDVRTVLRRKTVTQPTPPEAAFQDRDEDVLLSRQEQATEGSHVSVEYEDPQTLPDLANVAVAAIQSLATPPPPPSATAPPPSLATPKYKPVKVRQRPASSRHPFQNRATTPLPPSRSSPRPFSRVKDYQEYEDYYDQEPVDVPLSGKVRIHNDGFIECLDIGNFPHPFSCRKFISCAKMENSHLLGWEYTCPKGLSFDPIGGICNWNAGLGCKE